MVELKHHFLILQEVYCYFTQGGQQMNCNIYNRYPAMILSSGIKIYLQSISLSHTYAGLMCGSPSEQINEAVISETKEGFEMDGFVIMPDVTMVSEDDLFSKSSTCDTGKIVPLLPAVKAEALFECHEGEDSTYLNIVWFQDDFSTTMPSSIERVIRDFDWYRYACEYSL
jgi:hypothetical protein